MDINKKLPIRICPLGSGSKGNSIYIETPNGCVLVDSGFSAKELLLRMDKANLDPLKLDAILVTHEHSDHISGVGVIARRLNIPVFITQKTYNDAKLGTIPKHVFISSGNKFKIKDLEIEPIAIPHDAVDPVAYIFYFNEKKWSILTDFGYPTQLILNAIKECDWVLVEANHDEDLLINGPYPWPLKMRIKSRTGHLSNNQSVSMLNSMLNSKLKGITLLHLSETNNSPDLAYNMYKTALDLEGANHIELSVALQYEPSKEIVIMDSDSV